MNAYIAFVRKEFVEYTRTYKLLIVGALFGLFGMLNPVTAKLMPKLMESLMTEGIVVTLPEPSAVDSWTQFFKNMTGMQLLVLIIVFAGTLSGELSRGTLVNMLTKGLSRKTVILAKFTAVTAMWSAGYLLCFGLTYGYTLYLLPGNLSHLWLAAGCMWLYGVLLIAFLLLGSVLTGTIYGALLLPGGFAVLLSALDFIPKIEAYTPHSLSTQCLGLINGDFSGGNIIVPILLGCLLTFAALWGSLWVFCRKKL